MVTPVEEELAAYLKERNEALTNMDLDWVMKRSPGLPKDVIEIGLHKARYECTAIDKELRLQSGEWLRSKGYKRLGNMPLLPEGELP